MQIKRALVLGFVAVALTSAFPVAAAATEWKHEGKAFKKHVEIGISGVETLKVLGAEQECEFHATITTEGGSTAEFSEFEVIAESCVGSGFLAGCQVLLTKTTPALLKIDLTEFDFTATGIEIYRTYAPGCLVESTETTNGKYTFTLAEASAIASGKIHSFPETDINGKPSGTAEITGEFQVDEPNAGTYGIG